MNRIRQNGIFAASIALMCLSTWAPLRAQDEVGTDTDDDEPIEEIVVTVNRSGDRVDVDALYLEQLRTRIIKEFNYAQAEQEEELWRQSLRTPVQAPDSRIAWGYDAQSEAAMRRTSQINDLPIDRVKPATIFSIRF